MKIFLQRFSLISTLTVILSMNVYAADAVPAQLDTTPPPMDAALTADQTPPIPVTQDNNAAASTPGASTIGAGASSIGVAAPGTPTPTH